MQGGSVIMDWDQVVKKVSVSSNTSQMSALYDESTSTFWQSSGQQNRVCVCVVCVHVHGCIRTYLRSCVCVCVSISLCVHMCVCLFVFCVHFVYTIRYSTGLD